MPIPLSTVISILACFISLGAGAPTEGNVGVPASAAVEIRAQKPPTEDRLVASTFAPHFYQALGDKPRNDFITNFDFDGDWRGDNNWANADDKRFPLKAYIYYSVTETVSHFFIHYAVFHPRDYKGGEVKGTILSELIRLGVERGGKYDPTGLAEETALAHENDLEGCLVVVLKNGSDLTQARVVYVETLHHNTFSRYVVGDSSGFDRVKLEGQHPLLYIEPKGHGIKAFNFDRVEDKNFILYEFAGVAEDPEARELDSVICKEPLSKPCPSFVSYDLVAISTTLWAKALDAPNETYASSCDYGPFPMQLNQSGKATGKKFQAGKAGCAFVGRVGGQNMARPPWAWFDRRERERLPGRWFFDPAGAAKQNFRLGERFSTTYLRSPFWAN